MFVKEFTIEAPRAVAQAVVTVSAVHAESAALPSGDYYFVCTQGCSIAVGAAPVATASYPRIPANTPFRIRNFQTNDKISIIADAAGTAWLALI